MNQFYVLLLCCLFALSAYLWINYFKFMLIAAGLFMLIWNGLCQRNNEYGR